MKKSKFWKVYRISMLVLSILLIGVLVVLFFFLDSYEDSIPTHNVDDVITWINKNDSSSMYKYIKIDNKEVNDENNVKELLKFEKGNYFYTKNAKDYKDDKPVYSIYNKNKEIGTVYLKKKKSSNLFKLDECEIDYLEGFLADKKSITIYAPNNSKVLLNGHELGDKYIVEKEYFTDKMSYIKPYVDIPSFNKYEVKDVYVSSVSVNYNDKTQDLVDDKNTYVYKFEGNDELLTSLKDRLDTFVKNYTRYVVKEYQFSSVTPYIISNSNAYSFLQKIALTNLWSGNHTPTTFTDIEYINMSSYNEDAFEVDVRYTYSFNVYSTPKSFDTKLKLQVVKHNNNWYVVDLSTY